MSKENTKQYDLTNGGILHKLLLVALPVIGMQLMQMVYNLSDMFWMGRLGTDSLAAAATCGMYLWLSMGFMVLGRIGAEIGVSQSIGSGDVESARTYTINAFALAVFFGLFVGAAMLFGNAPLVGFFNIRESTVVWQAERYLAISGVGIPFMFMASVIAGAFTGAGNSKLIFYINAIGIVFNLILDPIAIFVLDMGITGAAVTNILGQFLGFVLSLWALYRHPARPFEKIKLLSRLQPRAMVRIFRWGLPVMLEGLLFPFLSMLITRVVAGFGATAIAAQRIGSQAESLTWLIAGGFCTAVTSFIGQNFGAGKEQRIRKGMRLSFIMLSIYGSMVTFVLYFLGEPIVRIFTSNQSVIEITVKYLQIAAFCQLVCCYEPLFAGYFRGIGLTVPPSAVSILGNVLRTAAVFVLAYVGLDLMGVYWIITLGAILRGGLLIFWYFISTGRAKYKSA